MCPVKNGHPLVLTVLPTHLFHMVPSELPTRASHAPVTFSLDSAQRRVPSSLELEPSARARRTLGMKSLVPHGPGDRKSHAPLRLAMVSKKHPLRSRWIPHIAVFRVGSSCSCLPRRLEERHLTSCPSSLAADPRHPPRPPGLMARRGSRWERPRPCA